MTHVLVVPVEQYRRRARWFLRVASNSLLEQAGQVGSITTTVTYLRWNPDAEVLERCPKAEAEEVRLTTVGD
jgi:hypothetical protein